MADESLIARPFEEEDTQAVMTLWQVESSDGPPWNEPSAVIRRKLKVQRDLFLVGELSGEVVATVLAGYDGVRGWVHNLVVAPEHRRNGFGGRMMAAAEEGLRALGCPKINLQVRSTNAEVTRFYESIGYSVEDRISMGRPLD